jgi:hypothetical protein
MDIPAASVLANASGQVMLLAEGGWGAAPPRVLSVTEAPPGTLLWNDGKAIGLAQASAMAALAAGKEFFLGEVSDGRIRTAGTVHVLIRHPAPTDRRMP